MTSTQMTTRDIFLNAPAEASPEVLSAYLDKACGDDAELRAKVEALIATEEEAGNFLEKSPLDAATLLDDAPLAEGPGDVIGNYKLLQNIGEGGFGVVYMADQLRPVKRRVALKIIKLGMDTRQVVARFEVERQALAMMDHPNIAKVLDAGSTETGRPYFVMELVRGIPITRFCDDQNLNTEERLKLFIDVCQAVQHAHQKGIIHRDLKPSNVMVTLHDDKAVPKVIDFGVAKATQADLTDKTLYTRYEQFIGTPAYMSPEQAQMNGLDIDTRSDIYALGVLLYELLTGRTPFDSKELLKAGQEEIRRVIREDEPPKPSTRVNTLEDQELTELAKHRKAAPERLHTLLRGDLDWIIMMALEKDRSRRYETANSMAMDIRHHLEDQPVMAAKPSMLYRLGKYTRRHRKSLIVAISLALVLAVTGSIIVWQALDSRDTQAALEKAESERLALEMEKQSKILRTERRSLVKSAVGLGQWEAARDYVSGFLDDPQIESLQGIGGLDDRGIRSLDGIKLAALHLILGDRPSHDEICDQMIKEMDMSSPGPVEERTVRAYFATAPSPEDPRSQKLLEAARNIATPDASLVWYNICLGIAEYRMGHHAEARAILEKFATSKNVKAQTALQPYLAMASHHLGDQKKAQHYLRGAQDALDKLNSSKVDYFWHELILGTLVVDEAKALIEDEE